jgi:acyl-CoA thioester hydrolase
MEARMKPPTIPLEQIRALGPPCLRMTVPEAYRDANGHMNMRWYVAIFDDAGDGLYQTLGLTPEFHRQHGSGTFDLEHHTFFVREVLPGDHVAVYARLVAHSPKRLHYVLFLLNETREALSAIFECVNTFADLRVRRTAAFPPDVLAAIAARTRAHGALEWPPPLSGAMRA